MESPTAKYKHSIDLDKLEQNPDAKQALEAAGLDINQLRAADGNQDAKLDLNESWRVADHFDHDGHAASLVAIDHAGNTTEAGQALNTLGLLLHNKNVGENNEIVEQNSAADNSDSAQETTAASANAATNAQASSQANNEFALDAQGQLNLSTEFLDGIEASNGPQARQRFKHWQNLVNEFHDKTDSEKLNAVDSFFNQNIRYVSDQNNQGVRDHWQDPVESLKLGKGDCEDYAMAKYSTLRMMGFDADKLHLSTVRLRTGGAHEVLYVQRDDFDKAVILDNMTHRLTFPDERSDLKPIYWANERGAQLIDYNWQVTSETMPISQFKKLSDVFTRSADLLPKD